MRETLPLSTTSHIPAITEVTCSPAFWQARAQLLELRQFSPACVALSERLTRELVITTHDKRPYRAYIQPRVPKDQSRHNYKVLLMPVDDAIAVTNANRYGRSVFSPATGQLNHDLLALEMIATHVAWDCGFAHVPYGIINRPDATFVASPRPWASDDQACELFRQQPKHTYLSNAFEVCAAQSPIGSACVYTLAVLDRAMRNPDRNSANLLVSADPKYPKAIGGIDMEGSLLYEMNKKGIKGALYPIQREFLDYHAPSAHDLRVINAAITVLQEYPLARFAQIAARVDSVSTKEVSTQALAVFQERTDALREDFSLYLPKGVRPALAKRELALVSQ